MSTAEAAIDNNERNERAEPEFVDINDPSFAEGELEGFDDQKDPLAFSIVRDGIYNVELDFAEQDVNKRWARKVSKQGTPYLVTRTAARILDGPFANRIVYDGFLSTMVFDGTTGVAKAIVAVGGNVAGARAEGEQARRLSQLLPARCRVQTKVEAREEGADKPFIKSERKFPEKEDGTPDFQKVLDGEGPEFGGQVYVEAKIKRYLPVE